MTREEINDLVNKAVEEKINKISAMRHSKTPYIPPSSRPQPITKNTTPKPTTEEEESVEHMTKHAGRALLKFL